MKILEYMRDATADGMITPHWVEDGGYWPNPADHTCIGIVGNTPEYHIPSSVHRLTASELETRVVAIHAANPIIEDKPVGDSASAMTTAAVRTMVQAWVTAKGID
jgi:hypothetical protein